MRRHAISCQRAIRAPGHNGGERMRRRSASAIGIGAVFAIVASLVAGVPVASGCQEPDLFIPGGSYGPGDPVPFSVSGTDSGATVAIDVGGQHFSFSDPGGEPGFAGSFPMPDMGDSPQSVPYDADVTHTDEGVPHTWSDPGSISFEPAAAPAGDGAGGNPSPTPNPAGHAQAPAPSTGGSELPVASGADTSSGTSSAANAGADTVHRGATQPVAATASVQHHREVSTATAASRGSRHQTASPATARRHAAVGRPAPSAVGIPSYAVLGLAGLIVLAGA